MPVMIEKADWSEVKNYLRHIEKSLEGFFIPTLLHYK